MNLFSTLRCRLILLVATVALPLVACAVWHALHDERVAIERARSSLQWAGWLAAATQDLKAESVRQVLLTLAQTPSL